MFKSRVQLKITTISDKHKVKEKKIQLLYYICVPIKVMFLYIISNRCGILCIMKNE